MRQTWDCWRLVLEAGIDYNTVFHQMDREEIALANAAVDLYLKSMPSPPRVRPRRR